MPLTMKNPAMKRWPVGGGQDEEEAEEVEPATVDVVSACVIVCIVGEEWVTWY